MHRLPSVAKKEGRKEGKEEERNITGLIRKLLKTKHTIRKIQSKYSPHPQEKETTLTKKYETYWQSEV